MRPARLRTVVLLLFAGVAGSAGAQKPGPNNAITDVTGVTVGHFTGIDAGTTVVRAVSFTASPNTRHLIIRIARSMMTGRIGLA
jgi:hypothetical protein